MEKKNLDDVTWIRLIVIVCLVLFHSFSPYCNAWRPFESFSAIESYKWIALLAYSFMLEAFVFISGYTFGHQRRWQSLNATTPEIKPNRDYPPLIVKKVKRLIVPSIIFSFLYLVLLRPHYRSALSFSYELLEGVGHIWFLPMLFWCFVAVCLVEIFKVKPRNAFIIFCAFSFVSGVNLPFRINKALNYLLFFYGGYVLARTNYDYRKYLNAKSIIFVFILFLSFFISGVVGKEMIVAHFAKKGLILCKILKFSYACTGLIFVFLLVNYLLDKKVLKVNSKLIELSSYCFGIYLFQEFIIQILYYRTSYTTLIPNAYIPWLTFVIALCLSFSFTYILKKTWARRII